MVTLKVIDAEKAKTALRTEKVALGQEVHISQSQYASNLMKSNPGAFEVVAGDVSVAASEAPTEEESKEMRPKANKMLTKAKASKYKSK